MKAADRHVFTPSTSVVLTFERTQSAGRSRNSRTEIFTPPNDLSSEGCSMTLSSSKRLILTRAGMINRRVSFTGGRLRLKVGNSLDFTL
jgi:hypothetical protein